MDWLPEPKKWRAEYARDGYVVVENAVEPSLLERLRAALDEIENGVHAGTLPPGLRRHIALERDRTRNLRSGKIDNDAVSNIMELPLFAPIFRDLIIYPRVLDILEALFETPEFAFHNYKCICKMPGNEAPFPWHRDLPYLKHTSPNLITAMLCIDPMTAENGGTIVCPGSHRVPHESVTDADTDLPESAVPAERVTVECPTGSAVLFHVNLIHGGEPNRSDRPRRNIIGIWSGPDTYPTMPYRYAYQSVMPRSADPERQKQIRMTFGDGDGAAA